MKDAKGHGSNKRGGSSMSKQPDAVDQHIAQLGQILRGELRGKQAQAVLNRSDAMLKLASDLKGSGGPKGSGQSAVARIAQQHGIQGGPFKVQSLALRRAGPPWATQKSYRNRTVAETVAKGMRTDTKNMIRVKVR